MKTVYIILENTKYGVYTRAFQSKRKRNTAVNELLKEYSKEYDTVILSVNELPEITMNEVWIDVFETKLE